MANEESSIDFNMRVDVSCISFSLSSLKTICVASLISHCILSKINSLFCGENSRISEFKTTLPFNHMSGLVCHPDNMFTVSERVH